MIKFSFINQSFYDDKLNYSKLPSDLIKITDKQHQELLNAVNSGCIVFADLTYSEPKPSQFHEWNGAAWVDNRTTKEIAEYERSLFPALSKCRFSLSLDDFDLYDNVMLAINSNHRLKIEYESISHVDRFGNIVKSIGLSESIIDKIWSHALKEY